MNTLEQVYDHLKSMPEALVKEVLKFVYVLENKKKIVKRVPGSAKKDLIKISEDFDAPLEEFENYQ
ncbi:MAG: DUF2281 domain-containing protein [Deltaproteobacteria bacterium]|nr:DUF2281 domain-containing protein [Deltaproteobacteria bacterium]